jgi:hypothetical protein
MFACPSDSTVKKYWIQDKESNFVVRGFPTVGENVRVMAEIVAMQPAKEHVAPLMEKLALNLYGSIDFSIDALVRVFCVGQYRIRESMSAQRARDTWTANISCAEHTFYPNANILRIVENIFVCGV